jgi:polar amino acid transport system substrate-binding protein
MRVVWKVKSVVKKFLFIFLFVSLIHFTAQAWDESSKELRWGADANSGAPFVFRDSKDPSKVIGLDVDVVNALAKQMGLKAVFVQNLWDGLVPGLQAGNYDIVADGLEIVDERKESISFSDPYYYTFEQLVVNVKTENIGSLYDLHHKKVGTLPASLAYRILSSVHGVNIKYYEEELNAYEELASGDRLDAVLLDYAIAKYYAAPNSKLKFVGHPVGRMLYGIGLRKNDEVLRTRINAALRVLIDNGTMKSILEKWGLWNKQSAQMWGQSANYTSEPVGYNEFLSSTGKEMDWKAKFNRYMSFVPLLAKGAVVTIEISLFAMILAIVLGLAIAVVRLYAHPFFARLAIFYIEVIRGTPLLIQLYLIFYGLPHIGLRLSPFFSAILGLGLNYAANEAENYRAGILAVPKSQMDAAFALGMSKRESLIHIIIPQALRLVIPPVTNDFIALIKDSSLVSVITLVELTTVYSQLATTYFDYLGIGLLTAAMYFLVGLPFARLSRFAEKRLAQTKKNNQKS